MMTGSTLSGRVWNIVAKFVFLLALIGHEWYLQHKLERATFRMTPYDLTEEMSNDSSCPVVANTDNNTDLVIGFTVPTGSHSGGNGYFVGPTYSPPQWELYIKWPSGFLVFLMVFRLCGWSYLAPLLPRASTVEECTGFWNSAVFVMMFVAHALTEVVFYFLAYHALKNIMGYETPKGLWNEARFDEWLNRGGGGGLEVAPRYPRAPPGELPHHICALTCRNKKITSVRFVNHLQYHKKDPADRQQILRDEESYHTGWRLRLTMYVSSAMVVLSVVLGVLSQALDNSLDLNRIQHQYTESRAPSPMPSPREPAALPPSLQLERDEFAREFAQAEAPRAGRLGLRLRRSRQT
jgi:hypothetical protein